jgi:phosphocarrier protein HPr
MLTKKIIISNKLGLHARAAAKFVSHAAHYSSDVEVTKGSQVVNGKSIMGVMMLAASQGTELGIQITGQDELAMMHDLETLVNNKFGEAE